MWPNSPDGLDCLLQTLKDELEQSKEEHAVVQASLAQATHAEASLRADAAAEAARLEEVLAQVRCSHGLLTHAVSTLQAGSFSSAELLTRPCQ